jgi:glutamine amidotransferase
MLNKKIVIIDSDICNVGSVQRAIKKIGFEAKISRNKDDINNSTHIILPGVGSFNEGIRSLEKFNLIEILKTNVKTNNKPLLGICLGMHLLAKKGFENGENLGLNFISGEVKELSSLNNELKLPHMGWNEVNFKKDALLENIDNNKDFYFVHRYFFDTKQINDIVATTSYGIEFPSIIKNKNIYGVQFHPEKSMKNGLKLLNNFIMFNA